VGKKTPGPQGPIPRAKSRIVWYYGDVGTDDLDRRIAQLEQQGVTIDDPRQVWVAADVDLARIQAGAVLRPGTRLEGGRTYVGPDAVVGREGPATLVDTVLARGASIASGFAQGAVLLRDASVGANAHLREGTLLEEQASTAHSVGLKHTILLSFVTLGSLVNFCDVLMAGGTSRADHSEVGSGFIHFNFTPWGTRGDKATPSLVGDVVRGALLRQPRIFLGGSGGMVGPCQVGYGSITAAGQVLRKPVKAGRLVVQASRKRDLEFVPGTLDAPGSRRMKNLAYLAELHALLAWYEVARRERLEADDRLVIDAAIDTLKLCIQERAKRLVAFLAERDVQATVESLVRPPPRAAFPLALCPGEPHVAWVRGLSGEAVEAATSWLETIRAEFLSRESG